MRILIILLLILFIIHFGEVSADPWQCGTPLLCERYANLQDKNINSLINVPAAPAPPVKLGQTERFFIHIPETSVNAICVNIGINCYLYVDTTVQDLLTENDAKNITETFDERIYSGIQEWVGSVFKPGIDRENKITILLHDVGLNKSGHDFGGYFSPTDLHPTHPTSNRRDILYMDIYQFKERTRHTFYSSLAHEFAHLVSWYQNGGTNDQRWLEEGLASFAEWGVYGTVHTLFVDNYLSNPFPSITTANTADIYYGAAFMYLLYLYENHGNKSIIRRISAENKLGLEGIGRSLNGTEVIDVFLNWGITNWFNNPGFGSEFSYRNLRNRKIKADIPQITAYPSRLNKTVNSWGFQYFLYKDLPEKLEISLVANPHVELYAKIVYILPNNKEPVVLPLHTNPEINEGQNTSTYTLALNNLKPEGQILLILTSPYTQTISSIVNPTLELDPINISNENDLPTPNINSKFRFSLPESVKYSPKSKTQIINNVGNRAVIHPSNNSLQLKPRTQIHLSSNYQDIIIQNGHVFSTSVWGLEVFRLGKELTKIAEVDTPGSAGSIAHDGENLFIADGKSGIHLFDISQPEFPRIVKTIKGFQDATYLHIGNGDLYTLDSIRGLLVYRLQDIYNLPNPHPKRFFIPNGVSLSVSTNGDDVYLSDNAVGVYILTTDPLGGFNVKGTYPIAALDFEIGEDSLQLVSNNLHILNVDVPAEPKPISVLNTPGLTTSIQRKQDFLYLTDKHAGLHIININNPFRPKLITSHATIGSANNLTIWESETSEEYVAIADGLGGIQTFEISNPYTPKWLSQYNAGGVAYDIDITNSDSRIAVAHGKGGLKVIELSDPFTGDMIQEVRLNNQEYGAICVTIEKDYAFIGLEDGMEIIDVISGDILARIITEQPVYAIDLINNYAYLCAGSLVVVDISKIELSKIVSNRNLNGTVYKMDHNATHVYVVALEGGLHILDISNPSLPRPIQHFQTEGAATNVTIADNYTYVLDTHNGVLKLDINQLNNLTLVATYNDTTIPIVAKAKDDFLFLLDVESLQVINTDTMQREIRYTQLHVPSDILVTDNALYISDLYQLNIFQIDTRLSNLGVEDNIVVDSLSVMDLSQGPINQLYQNYPNPFNPETWIPISLSTETELSLSIYDEKGRLVRIKEYESHLPGKHILHWNGRNSDDEMVASGIYFYTISARDFKATRKMVIRR
ncbi:T9SS type A sorting domain-containing protein [Candidatus Poribacteria bacterium]|nr:T9SS type A sorting domain-containing protein [Candidatus Poribacteria bacterium]